MKTIETPERLILAFSGLLQDPLSEDFSLKASPNGKKPELRLKAAGRQTRFSILPDLHPSRKVLHRSIESNAKPFLLLSPHIPDDLAKDFRKQGINHADLNGRLFLKTTQILLDRDPRGKTYRGPAVSADLFSLKTSRLIRALLSHPGQAWQQAELSARTRTSLGLVSRILNALLEEGYIAKDFEGTRKPAMYRVQEGDRLLDAWRAADVWKKRVHIREYSLLKNDPLEIAKTAREALGSGNLAFTQWFAGYLRFPYTTPSVVSAYVGKEGLPEIRFAREVSSGGNLWLIVPKDEGVLWETRQVQGFTLVSDIQIYLDLLQVGQRGPEQAEALRNWEGFNT